MNLKAENDPIGSPFRIVPVALSLSKMLLKMVDSSDSLVIPFDVAVVESVVTYLNHHQGTIPVLIMKPLRSKLMIDNCADAWDASFIDRAGAKRLQLFNLILAANYLAIPSLVDLGCAKVASLIKAEPLELFETILWTDDDYDEQANLVS